MTVLTGKTIAAAIGEKDVRKRLIVTPFFSHDQQTDPGAASLDLRLGTRFCSTRRRRHGVLPAYSGEGGHPRHFINEHYVPLGGQFYLHPHQFVLATTLEWIRLPAEFCGYVTSRSTYGRRGLVIATAIGVHPNYSGVITLELSNVAEVPIELEPGQAICQLFLQTVKSARQSVDHSVFHGSLFPQLGPAPPDHVSDFLRAQR
jgi:dCTP deaminase